MQLKTRLYPELDSLRFIAVSLVALHHLYFENNFFFKFFKNNGDIGVDLFFVISGFIITLGLQKEIHLNKFNYLKFIARRIVRLWPQWILALMCSSFVFYYFYRENQIAMNDFKLKIWHYFFHFGNYSYIYWGSLHSLFGHFWSLAVEEHFYLAWPLLLFLQSRLPRRLVVISYVLLLLFPIFLRYRAMLDGQSYFFITFSTQTRLDSLITGCLLAYLYPQITKLKSNWFTESFTLVTIVLLFLVGQLFLKEHGNLMFKSFYFTFINFSAFFLICIALTGDSIVRRVLKNKFISRLGLLSYGVYLFHILTYTVVFAINKRLGYPLNQNIIGLLCFILPYFPAYFGYVYVDQNLNFLKNKFHAAS